MLGKQPERPIFFDRTGKRWRIAKLVSLAALIGLAAAAYILVPNTLSSVQVPTWAEADQMAPAASPQPLPPEQLAATIDQDRLPVIGSGPLLRVVRMTNQDGRRVAVDPYTGSLAKRLSSQDQAAIGRSPYAIERYGATRGKRLALTFDDGPDPVYTPRILDLLSRENAPASFFALGSNVSKHPELASRIVREGHVLANHTFSHADLNTIGSWRASQEINLTQRVIRSTVNRNPAYFRIPYGGNDIASIRDNLQAILAAQHLGYTVVSYQFNSLDWAFGQGARPTLPAFTGRDQVVLLHDAGGNRSSTINYLKQLIREAKAHGYSFANLEQLYPQPAAPLFATVEPAAADHAAAVAAQSLLTWPQQLIRLLYALTVGIVYLTLMVKIVLAVIHLAIVKYRPRPPNYQPLASVIIPAFNEQAVLAKTVDSLLASKYRNFEIIMVDDGSSDGTGEVIEQLSRTPGIRGFHQPNSGKPAALNRGLAQAHGEIIVTIDADSVVPPDTLDQLVRHFKDPSVGAVAGTVKVGNIRNLLTRWQALDYIVGINVERVSQSLLGAIVVVPGACSAWRKRAIEQAGGYSAATLAEDCDLALAVTKNGWRLVQDTEAVSYTEAPEKLGALIRQRFRWTYGNIQAFWKHRDMLFRARYNWLGWLVLPTTLAGTLFPLLFVPVLSVIAVENLLAGRYWVLLVYLLLNLGIQFMISLIGVLLAKEKLRHLLALPVYRLVYSPLRTYLIYRALLQALKGAAVGWNKLSRTGSVRYRASRPSF